MEDWERQGQWSADWAVKCFLGRPHEPRTKVCPVQRSWGRTEPILWKQRPRGREAEWKQRGGG